MRKTKLLLCLLALMPFVGAAVGDTDELKKEINRIKKSSLYLYGEGTDSTAEAAHELAEEILETEINKWAATKKRLQNSTNFIVNNKKSLRTTIALPRGNMFRAFVYVKKSDIMAGENSTLVENTRPVSAIEDMTSTVTDVHPDVVVALSECTEYADLASKIQLFKSDGKIKSFARYADLERPEACYLAIYDRAGKVLALLTPGSERKNVSTGQPDGTSNYSGCGAIGFELNK